MRRPPLRAVGVVAAVLVAAGGAVAANLALVDRAPSADPLGRLNPALATVDAPAPPGGPPRSGDATHPPPARGTTT
ncbi:MAG TPA: hypothetical protein VNT51_09040, partial [Miltoncostaeaceae bacterium]|nr:hypothetical protein [Miltoncostaeaceae bacterium]